MPKVHVTGIEDANGVVSEATFNYVGSTKTYPIVTTPAFKMSGSPSAPVCPEPPPKPGADSFQSPDQKWKATIISQTEKEVTFEVTFDSPNNVGWFALGISLDGSMTSGGKGTDIFACESGTGKVNRYWADTRTTAWVKDGIGKVFIFTF